MQNSITKVSLILGCLSIVSLQALTLNGSPRSASLSVCFDEASIGAYIGYGEALDNNEKWVKNAIEQDTWGYYTNLTFTGWTDCASNPNANIHISQDPNGGVYSSGNTIYLPFYNTTDPSFQRYHLQSGAIHEMGHQLNFPHEHLRVDSTYYAHDTVNQKFRITMVNSPWFTITPDANTNLCLTVSATDLKVTQEICTNSSQQLFKFKDSSYGNWTRIENLENGNCLDIQEASQSSGAKLIHWSCQTNDNQYFKTMQYPYTNITASIYGFQVKHSQLWLDIPEGSTQTGIQPIQYGAYFDNYTHLTPYYDGFSIMSYENGAGRPTDMIMLQNDIDASRIAYGNSGASKISDYIVAKISNKCFSYDGTEGSQQVCNPDDGEQKLRAVYLDPEYFRLFDEETQKCLTEYNNNLILTTCSQESENSANDNQTRIQVISATPHYAAKPSKILPKKTS